MVNHAIFRSDYQRHKLNATTTLWWLLIEIICLPAAQPCGVVVARRYRGSAEKYRAKQRPRPRGMVRWMIGESIPQYLAKRSDSQWMPMTPAARKTPDELASALGKKGRSLSDKRQWGARLRHRHRITTTLGITAS